VTDSSVDVKEWLREIIVQAQRSDSFIALRDFRSKQPGKQIPDDLKFVELYAALLGENESPFSYEDTLSHIINKLVVEDERAKGGGSFSSERIQKFERIDQLSNKFPEMRLEDAAAKVMDELIEEGQDAGPPPENDPIGNLIRSYHYYQAIMLLQQIGDTVVDGDEAKGTALIGEYLRRMKSSKSNHKTHNK